MRRARQRDLDHDEVITAAVTVAFADGLHAVSVAAVAAHLDVPDRLVAAFRPEWPRTVASAFRRIVSAELAEVKRFVLSFPAPLEQLRALLDTLAEPVRAEVDAVWLEAWSLGRRNAVLGEAVREEEGAWHAFVAAVIRRGVRSGDFADVDVDEAAALLLAVIDGVNAYALVGYRTDLDRSHLLHEIARHRLGVSFDQAAVRAAV